MIWLCPSTLRWSFVLSIIRANLQGLRRSAWNRAAKITIPEEWFLESRQGTIVGLLEILGMDDVSRVCDLTWGVIPLHASPRPVGEKSQA